MSTIAVVVALAVTLCAVGAMAQPAGEPIRLHPENGHYLLLRGKPTILITSGEHYGAVMNADFDYARYLDELAAKGLNLTRLFSGTYLEVADSFGITDNTLAPRRYLSPWARSTTAGAADAGAKFDLTRYDEAYFARLKDFLTQASRRGIVVEYVLFCPFYEEKLWAANPMNTVNNVNGVGACPRTEVYTLQHKDLLSLQQAFVRKAVAELKDFDNLYYEICNEPYFGGVTAEWQAQIAQTIVDAEKTFAHKHLIAQNIGNGSAKIENPNAQVSIFNFHYGTPPDAVRENYGLNRVIADDETGFRGSDDATYRGEGWEFIIGGGAIYSSLDYSFTPAHPAGDLRGYKSPGGGSAELRSQLVTLKRFMEGFDFIRMTPHNEIVHGGTVTAALAGSPAQTPGVTVRALAEVGKAYAIYVRGGTAVELRVDLPAGPYRVEWINTRTGKTDKADQFAHDGGPRKLASPGYSEDIALRISRL